jgi:hypothetical protein
MRSRLVLSAAFVALVASVSLPASADGVMPAAATPVQREQAQARFARGKELLGKKQYDAALAEFRASHEIVGSPNTRLELARCLRAMGRMVAAYAELGRAAVEAKELVGQDNRYQRAFDSASTERAEIEPQLGFVALTIQNPTDDTKVTVGGEEIRRAAWGEPAPAVAGSTEVIVETPGHAPLAQLDRATASGAVGQRFESSVARRVEDAPRAHARGGVRRGRSRLRAERLRDGPHSLPHLTAGRRQRSLQIATIRRMARARSASAPTPFVPATLLSRSAIALSGQTRHDVPARGTTPAISRAFRDGINLVVARAKGERCACTAYARGFTFS